MQIGDLVCCTFVKGKPIGVVVGIRAHIPARRKTGYKVCKVVHAGKVGYFHVDLVEVVNASR